MKDHPYLYKIEEFVQNEAHRTEKNQAKIPISRYGTISCRSRQRIARVPFLYPSLVLVVRGHKTIYRGDNEIQCFPGEFLALPAQSTFDVVNTPDVFQMTFLALYLHFDNRIVERFRRLYRIDEPIITNNTSIHFTGDELLNSTVWHFLETSKQLKLGDDVKEHRLMEVLLCLVRYCNASHMLLSMSQKWSERVYSLLLSNPSRGWLVKDVCSLLGVSESTLRRNLRREGIDFRSIIEDVRMGLALSEVQFTDLPISMIAHHCGYSSFSRFSSRFRQRFDTTPSQLRKEMAGSG